MLLSTHLASPQRGSPKNRPLHLQSFELKYVDPHGFDTYLKEYFISGKVKFVEVLDYYVVMQNIEVGYVLNIVGVCQGLKQDYVYIGDCWIESVKGDLGKGGLPLTIY